MAGQTAKKSAYRATIWQVFRLDSPKYDKYEYLIGAYYADADTTRSSLRNPGLPLFSNDWHAKSTTESYAIFGQGTWRFTGKTSTSTGLRWNNEKTSVDFAEERVQPIEQFDNNDSDSGVVGDISLPGVCQSNCRHSP